jgi:hypothetical protein
MIPRDEWLEPEEWQALGDSEAHVYKDLADSYGLDMNDCRDGRILDSLYRLHVDSAWKLPIEIPKRARPSWLRIRNVEAAHEGNRLRGIETLQAVKAAWHVLRHPDNPKPSTKEMARRASILLGRSLSPRHTTRLISELRKSGDIP